MEPNKSIHPVPTETLPDEPCDVKWSMRKDIRLPPAVLPESEGKLPKPGEYRAKMTWWVLDWARGPDGAATPRHVRIDMTLKTEQGDVAARAVAARPGDFFMCTTAIRDVIVSLTGDGLIRRLNDIELVDERIGL